MVNFKRVAVVTPVLNDWESFQLLAKNIGGLPSLTNKYVTIVAVDDGSTEGNADMGACIGGAVADVRVLHLHSNQGHQRAIALGLAYVHRDIDADITIVMDSDGEDNPLEIEKMLESLEAAPDHIVVAHRKRRSEGLTFKLFYAIYKSFFYFLTGKAISFGNFSAIPSKYLSNILYSPGIWNNYAATVIKSRVPIEKLPTTRSKRYFGSSKMNFTSLMIHGFGAISVFSDIVIGRLILILASLVVTVAGAIVALLVTKLTTDMLVPGYATNVILLLTTFTTLSLFNGFVLILSLLAARERAASLPSAMLSELVGEVEKQSVTPMAVKANT